MLNFTNKYIAFLLVFITSANCFSQTNSDWIYINTNGGFEYCFPNMTAEEGNDELFFSCIYDPMVFGGNSAFVALFDRETGTLNALNSFNDPATHWSSLYGATNFTEPQIYIDASGYQVINIEFSPILDTTSVELITENIYNIETMATVGENVYLTGFSGADICLTKVDKNNNVDTFCVSNPDFLGIASIKSYKEHLYVGLEGSDSEFGVIKFDSAGNHLWSSTFFATDGLMPPMYKDMKFLDNGDVILIGSMNESTLTGYDLIAVRFDHATGDIKWDYRFSLHDDTYGDEYKCSFIDENNTLHLLGTKKPGYPFENFFFLSIDSSGNLIDSTVISESGYLFFTQTSIDNNFILWGRRALNDYPLQIFDASGIKTGEYSYADIDALDLTLGYQIKYLSTDEIYLYSREDITNMFLARVSIPTSGTEDNIPAMERIFPNPSNGNFTIQCEDCKGYSIEVISNIGEILYSQPLSSTELNLHGVLVPGIYFVQLINPNKMRSTIPVVVLN